MLPDVADCKVMQVDSTRNLQQLVPDLPFAVQMTVAAAVTSPELVLAVEVCKDPGRQKDSLLLIHNVDMSKNMRLAFLQHIGGYLSSLYFCQCAFKSLEVTAFLGASFGNSESSLRCVERSG